MSFSFAVKGNVIGEPFFKIVYVITFSDPIEVICEGESSDKLISVKEPGKNWIIHFNVTSFSVSFLIILSIGLGFFC